MAGTLMAAEIAEQPDVWRRLLTDGRPGAERARHERPGMAAGGGGRPEHRRDGRRRTGGRRDQVVFGRVAGPLPAARTRPWGGRRSGPRAARAWGEGSRPPGSDGAGRRP